jgi:hypothetical protein
VIWLQRVFPKLLGEVPAPGEMEDREDANDNKHRFLHQHQLLTA